MFHRVPLHLPPKYRLLATLEFLLRRAAHISMLPLPARRVKLAPFFFFLHYPPFSRVCPLYVAKNANLTPSRLLSILPLATDKPPFGSMHPEERTHGNIHTFYLCDYSKQTNKQTKTQNA